MLQRLPAEHLRVVEAARSAYQGGTSENWDEMLSDARSFAVFAEPGIRGAGSHYSG